MIAVKAYDQMDSLREILDRPARIHVDKPVPNECSMIVPEESRGWKSPSTGYGSRVEHNGQARLAIQEGRCAIDGRQWHDEDMEEQELSGCEIECPMEDVKYSTHRPLDPIHETENLPPMEQIVGPKPSDANAIDY